MPKKQSTAAQRARQRQAASGENYTTALRARSGPPFRHKMFSARGAGWAPIIERAERDLALVWPGHPAPHWEEKFGDLCWKGAPWSQGPDVWAVVGRALREAATTCQTCPSPGRKRVVWIWDTGEFRGWVMPWVKTCCDACGHVPHHLRSDESYLDLVEEYEEDA
ncbi:hypothetical protein AVW11_17045 [Streptomyces amritsarensis]|uniref:Uncharacterized protein n=1 Tax=Streptomyces amritsarensis TaxID=681158 RepID=A0ABX3G1H7_9ACTN|nr:hypothetical protein [Streptomyces amritsarensis]OLZ65497.1 hypothetical protein AVW11_17045 [Streptomyces amritsarensis]